MKNVAKVAETEPKKPKASKGATKAPKVAKVIPIKSAVEVLCEQLCKVFNESDYSGDAKFVVKFDGNEYEMNYIEYEGPGDEDDEGEDEDEESAG